MKKLFFIPLFIFGFFIFVSFPLLVAASYPSKTFEILKNEYLNKFCSTTKVTKAPITGSLCYLLNRDMEQNHLVVYDNQGNKLGPMVLRNDNVIQVYSIPLGLIIRINSANGKLGTGAGIFYKLTDCKGTPYLVNPYPNDEKDYRGRYNFNYYTSELIPILDINGGDKYYKLLKDKEIQQETFYSGINSEVDYSTTCNPIDDTNEYPSKELNVLSQNEIDQLVPFLNLENSNYLPLNIVAE